MRKLRRITKEQRLEELSTGPENIFEREGSLLDEALGACRNWKKDTTIGLYSQDFEVDLEGQPVDPDEAEQIKREVDYVVAELTALGWSVEATLDDSESFNRLYELRIS